MDNDSLAQNNLSPLIPKSKEAIEFHNNIFLPFLSKRLQEKLNEVNVSIFVCGPDVNDKDNPLCQKRIDTINKLREQKYDVFTGEEIVQEMIKQDLKNGQPEKPVHLYEMTAAGSCDMVILFRASYGSVAELHDFLSDNEIAERLWIFADIAHKKGYSSNGRVVTYEMTHRPVNYYTAPQDIEQCRLLSNILKIAYYHRLARYAEINKM